MRERSKLKIKRRIKFALLAVILVASLCVPILPMHKSYAAAGEVSVTDSKLYWSPYSWIFSGSTYAQTPTTGSYLKVAFTGSTIALDMDTSTFDDVTPNVIPSSITMDAYIDGSTTPVRKTLANISSGELVFKNDLAAGNHYAQIYIAANGEYTKRWGTFSPDTPAAALVRITAIQLATDGEVLSLTDTPLAQKTPMVIFYGDSITEGNGIGTTYAEDSYDADLARLLDVEYFQHAYASLTWGASFFSGTPSFYHTEAEGVSYGRSVWRNSYKGQSLLVGDDPAGGYIGGVPDAVFNNMGINDYGARGAGWNTPTDMKTRITGWLTDERTALGARPAIFMIVPFNYGNAAGDQIPTWKAAYLEGISDYQTSHPEDKRIYTIDLGEEGYNIVAASSSDTLHPNPTGAAELAQLIYAQVGDVGNKIILDQDLTAKLDGKTITDGMTIDKLPTFTGTAPAGSTITVTVHSDPITCTAVADTSGNWSCTFATAIPAGAHSLAISADTVWGSALELASVGINVNDYSGGGTDSQTLANTGQNSALLTIIALTTLGLGVGLSLRRQLRTVISNR